MPQALDIQKFIWDSSGKGNVIDVRSPKEFAQGHVPGATNIPLFSNEERAVVGTIYKQKGREEAIVKGLEIVGPKMAGLVLKARELAQENTLYVHCWRGGMRSGSVAWLLEMYGLKVFTLKRGYKAFRTFALTSFNTPKNILLLSGRTGSGKTLILHKLKELGEQVVDLEGLAKHKGSAFGALGETEPPTQEQFENELCVRFMNMNPEREVWLEDEARLIGKKVIPEGLWTQMREAKIKYVNLPFEERVNYLVKEYGKFPMQQLEESILKITKRLGNEQTKDCINALKENDLKTTCEICLKYYDKSYEHGLHNRENLKLEDFPFDKLDADVIAKKLIDTK
ncbi:MAG: selU [Bacteroidetes bacterium]|jgi:tRNA 2-selenouridine synthase|nr:selU [Bacteroidota bacterium]